MTRTKRVIRFIIDKSVLVVYALFRIFKNCIRWIHRKKRYSIPFCSFLAYILLVISLIKFSGDPTFDKVVSNKLVNDVTKLNPIQVGELKQPHTIDEIVDAIIKSEGPIS